MQVRTMRKSPPERTSLSRTHIANQGRLCIRVSDVYKPKFIFAISTQNQKADKSPEGSRERCFDLNWSDYFLFTIAYYLGAHCYSDSSFEGAEGFNRHRV